MEGSLKKRLSIILGFVAAGMFFSSCYQDVEGCLDPFAKDYDLSADLSCGDCCSYPSVKVSLLHRYEYDSLLVSFDSIYTNDLNQTYVLKSFDFYIRDVKLLMESGKSFEIDDSLTVPLKTGDSLNIENTIGIVDFKTSEVFKVNFEETNYGKAFPEEQLIGIKFNIGLLDLATTLDRTAVDSSHFLFASADYMYDEVSARYHNAIIKYALDTAASAEIFEINIDLNKEVVLYYDSYPINDLGIDINCQIRIDYKEFFNNIDFENDSENIIGEKWLNNGNYAFKIIE